MKISRVLTAAMAAALLTSCAGNSGSSSQQAEEVIITPTEVQETTAAVTGMSETAFSGVFESASVLTVKPQKPYPNGLFSH